VQFLTAGLSLFVAGWIAFASIVHVSERSQKDMKRLLIIVAGVFLFSGIAGADTLTVHMYRTSAAGQGKAVGTITVKDTAYGALFAPDLKGLPPGLHGFHVHENADCGAKEKNGKRVPGLAAGGHYDPAGSGRHEGPYGNGHLGDLPPLYVDAQGTSTLPVLAPRIKVADLNGRSLMIHAGGDNFSDHPAKLGGGGARQACGIVK
jgi:superoxide dismutase, Cu-Zn family